MSEKNLAQYDELLAIYTAVIVSPKGILTSNKPGIAPLLEWIENKPDYLVDAYLIDRVIGTAAALLAIKGKIKLIYTKMISKKAEDILDKNNLRYKAKNEVDRILDKTGNDTCPLEKLTSQISDPQEAYLKLKEFTKRRM